MWCGAGSSSATGPARPIRGTSHAGAQGDGIDQAAVLVQSGTMEKPKVDSRRYARRNSIANTRIHRHRIAKNGPAAAGPKVLGIELYANLTRPSRVTRYVRGPDPLELRGAGGLRNPVLEGRPGPEATVSHVAFQLGARLAGIGRYYSWIIESGCRPRAICRPSGIVLLAALLRARPSGAIMVTTLSQKGGAA